MVKSQYFQSRWLASEDQEKYETLHTQSKGATPFNAWRWWESIDGFSENLRLLGTFDEKKRLVGAAAFLARYRFGILHLDIPLPIPHSAIIIRDAPLSNPARLFNLYCAVAENMSAFLHTIPRCALALLQTAPSWKDPRGWQWNGMTVMPRLTSVCSIENFDRWIKKWTTPARARFRKGERENWKVEWDTPAHSFYRLWKSTLIKSSLPVPLNRKTFTQLAEVGKREGWASAVLCRPSEECGEHSDHALAGAFIVWSKGVGYYLLAGSTAPGRQLGLPTFLVGKTGQRLARRYGVCRYDLCGVNITATAEFKRSFGGALVPYWAIWRRHPLYAALKEIFSWRQMSY